MESGSLLKHLEDAAGKLDVGVSYEPISVKVGMGGLCRVNGKYRVIIDKRTSEEERVMTLAKALATFDLEAVGLSKEVQDAIHFYA